MDMPKKQLVAEELVIGLLSWFGLGFFPPPASRKCCAMRDSRYGVAVETRKHKSTLKCGLFWTLKTAKERQSSISIVRNLEG
jgi:hypothetical protein